MVEFTTLLAFIPAALALNLTPGADMMFCVGQGLRGGVRAATSASFGISIGSFVHVTLAGIGLGALVSAYPAVFDVIRWMGITYLVWLAIKVLRSPLEANGAPAVSAKRAFWDGLLVNLTNPKVILFVLAFIPQFVDPSRGSILAQFLVFGAVLGLGGFVINALAGIFAGGLGGRITGAVGFQRGLRWVSATVFGALAVRLALEK
ncbi:LysE family translocator [Pseudohalocynthiibacter aestuariivivens]|jgi:threonine/homoserine/homoserine lactone efflux protein|uniref:LysE family translocator n=1 Tax=Pseudohalocynthiibacter aestuariivivens TaxID=1591409 RepID=A0ABV5JIC1_9RHOB|nr:MULTISPECIES: LysE family translocator [Pseudohalocynthiibacter]MBS9717507.1 LysE family translocator [Pseudohalocynthiibacter aestuariivivens]MCK0102157.1 LysE family translocator [Pseudohalocynthiibacter sp. F2068]